MEHPDQTEIEVFAKDSISITANLYKNDTVPEIRWRIGTGRGCVDVPCRISGVYRLADRLGAGGYGRGSGLLRALEETHGI